jgi:hypothetical protein
MTPRTREVGATVLRVRDLHHVLRGAASFLRMKELALGDAAPDLILLDPEERPVALSSLWQRAPLALIFLRHFG